MSMWCPKCNKINYSKYKCDFCGYDMGDVSKGHKIPKYKKRSIIDTEYEEKKTITVNKNIILVVSAVVTAISLSYLAINKFTEDTPQEKLLKSLYGKSDIKEIERLNKIEIEKINNSIENTTKVITNKISNIKPAVIDFGKSEREKKTVKQREKEKLMLQMQN